MPDRELLAAIRNHIAVHHEELRRILRAKPVRTLLGGLYGEQSTRVPKGFLADDPAADLLRYKRFILFVELPPELATSRQLYPEILKRFRAMGPFMRFLDAAARTQKKPPAARFVNEM